MKKIKKIVFKIVVLGIVGYVIFLFVDQCLKIRKKSEELSNINRQIVAQINENQRMKNELEENSSENAEDKRFKGSETIVFENVME